MSKFVLTQSPPPLSSAKPSHPSWNSLVSDITMSEDDEGHPTPHHQHHRNHQQPPPPPPQPLQNHQQHPSRYYRHLERNEDSAASLLEYSQSSEEAYSVALKQSSHDNHSHQHHQHQRENTVTSLTNFRFADITQSSRIVRFASSSDDLSSASSSQHPLPAEEDGGEGVQVFRGHSKSSHGKGNNNNSSSGGGGSKNHLHHHDKSSPDKNHRRHRHHHREHHRGGGATVNRDTFLSTSNRWMTQLAYSFRTPPPPKKKKQPTSKQSSATNSNKTTNKTKTNKNSNKASTTVGSRSADDLQDLLVAKQHQFQQQALLAKNQNISTNSETSPLLPLKELDDDDFFDNDDDEHSATFPRQQLRHSIQHGHQKLYASTYLHRHSYDYISIAVAFLKDYEAARPPTLPSNVALITTWQMGLYRIKYSTCYSLLLGSATVALFLSSALEGPSPADSNFRMNALTGLNLFALVIFGTDMWIRYQFQRQQPGSNPQRQSNGKKVSPSKTFTALPVMVQTRSSHANLLTRPLFLFGLFLGLENLGWLLANPDRTFVVLYSSIWKPIVLYYISRQARHAMEALTRIARTVIRILVIEMVLILSFAAVACRLFQDFEAFDDLSNAWLSLFKLATTVVNPSIWMPMYEKTHWSATFFVLFIVVTVFYMHSLVLSVVFQTYIQAAGEIHDRSVADREDALQLAYASLKKQHQQDARKQQLQQQQQSQKQQSKSDDKTALRYSSSSGIPMYLVREALESLRPHYNAMKINALLEIFDINKANYVDYPTFRTKIRQALNASIRTARIASPLAMSIELTAVIVAVVNFIYVICLTSSFNPRWFEENELQLGAIITIAGLAELLMRANPLRVPNFTPMTRFNATFDGLAMLGALISCVGIGLWIAHREESAIEYILMGRAVDMVRVMRFFQIFRDVVRRSSDVVPAMIGPITLVLTLLHIFVYIGMAFWGGAIEVGELTGDEITPLYDLNNFNSYLEGLVTMFQVLVVNDWHAIAEVFLYASRCSSPTIVYPFFVIGNLVGVSILLNVITAFFVESFVTKLGVTDGGVERPESASNLSKDFSLRTSENKGVKRICSSNSFSPQLANTSDRPSRPDDDSDAHDADSEGSSDSSELFQFDVYEREGYDTIIQTVSGGQQQDDYARQVCNHLELFESLIPGREKVGYLVCCQQSMSRYGNRRFETEASDFVGKMELYSLVSDMHAELLALLLSSKISFKDRSLIRVYPHPKGTSVALEISATILRRNPALSLFVSRIVPANNDQS